jgi:hypothetical protein
VADKVVFGVIVSTRGFSLFEESLKRKMERDFPRRTVPGIGIANTVRFAWRRKDTEPIGREKFSRTVLMVELKLEVQEVMCLQDNPLEKAFDVTFCL